MIFAYPLFLKGINYFMVVDMGLPSPFESSESIPIALSYFHTIFNITNVLLLIWFVPTLVKIATKLVPSKGEQDEESVLTVFPLCFAYNSLRCAADKNTERRHVRCGFARQRR